MMAKLTLFLLGLVSSINTLDASVPHLDEDDFEETTAGKTVFIKFYAPWCGHCKAMSKDWQRLYDDWEDDENVVVASVDCTDDDSESLCDDYDVAGYPTLKFGDITDLHDYEGDRSYEALSAFAKENLKPTCSVKNIDLCSPKKKAFIEMHLAMSEEEFENALDEVEEKLMKLEDEAEETIQEMQDEYDAIIENFLVKQESLKKKNNYGLMKSIRSVKVFAEIKKMEEGEKEG
mmetsp:Transcript_9179/g.12761  ORF Transcript_9179/g.12761 Transcript_9179/m.12761 type:complete len:233 (-) Transcript_9179:437-1135(-)